jgi:hypothetical protein
LLLLPPPLLLLPLLLPLLLLLLYTRLRQLVALGHTDELQAELEKFKRQPTDLRSHLEKVCSTTQGCWYADIIKVSMQYAPYLA